MGFAFLFIQSFFWLASFLLRGFRGMTRGEGKKKECSLSFASTVAVVGLPGMPPYALLCSFLSSLSSPLLAPN
jgi:hypothetical protein